MPKKIIHLIRHGAGEHDETHNYTIHDPTLTSNGAIQAAALRDILARLSVFPSIELVASSPLRRCIQTALIAFWPYFTDHTFQPLLLLPRSQESSSEPSNTGSSISEIRDFFKEEPVKLDFSYCEEYPDFNSKQGLFAPTVPALEERAKELRVLLKERKEERIVVVAHGDFLHHITGMISSEGEQAGGDWMNAEWRCYEFVDEDGGDEGANDEKGNKVVDREARIVETEWSWKRRGAKGPSLRAGDADKGRELEGIERGW